MSNYSSLKATIDANIKTNGNQEITGQVMNSVLNQMVTTMGQQGYLYAGIAHPSDAAITTDAKVFFFATEAGEYTNKGGLEVVDGEIAILKYDTTWSKEVLDINIETEVPYTEEEGFFVTDPSMNVGMQYTEDGLDFAKISEHAVQVLKGAGIGADVEFIGNTEEAGFFVVDSELNIGAKVDEDGVHAKNILEYEIVEE